MFTFRILQLSATPDRMELHQELFFYINWDAKRLARTENDQRILKEFEEYGRNTPFAEEINSRYI
jgi:hypothetical protein